MVGGGRREAELSDGFLQELADQLGGQPFVSEGQALIRAVSLLRSWQNHILSDGRSVFETIVVGRLFEETDGPQRRRVGRYGRHLAVAPGAMDAPAVVPAPHDVAVVARTRFFASHRMTVAISSFRRLLGAFVAQEGL
jgi:hypothetical protein